MNLVHSLDDAVEKSSVERGWVHIVAFEERFQAEAQRFYFRVAVERRTKMA